MLLRPTTETDRHALVAIREHPEARRRWRGDDLDAEFTQDLIDDGCVQLTILTEHDGVVGLVQFSEETDPDHRHAGIDIYIAPEHHRRGTGATRWPHSSITSSTSGVTTASRSTPLPTTPQRSPATARSGSGRSG